MVKVTIIIWTFPNILKKIRSNFNYDFEYIETRAKALVTRASA